MTKEKNIKIPKLELGSMEIQVEAREGSTLMTQKMSDEVKQELKSKYEDGEIDGKKQENKAKEEIAESKIHRTEDDDSGIPAEAFKKALMKMAKSKDLKGVTGKLVAGAVKVMGNILPIEYEDYGIDDRWGTRSGPTGAPIEIIRPEFTEWSCKIPITYDTSMISAQQVINLLNRTGFHIGVGSFRCQNGGNFGMFKVTETK